MKYFLIVLFSFSLLSIHGQIIGGTDEKEPLEEVKTKEKVKKEKSGIELYFGATPSYTYRTLKINEGLFAKPLDYREDEKGVWTSGYFIGVRNPLYKSLKLDIGVGYSVNKEIFSFESADSLFQYTNSYRHIAVPIKAAYSFGEGISFYAAIGIVPKAFLSLKNTTTTFDKYGEKQTEDLIIRDKYNFFLLDAVVDAGVQIKLGDYVGIFVFLEGRHQLVNNYTKQGPYIRKPFALGFNCGIDIYL